MIYAKISSDGEYYAWPSAGIEKEKKKEKEEEKKQEEFIKEKEMRLD